MKGQIGDSDMITIKSKYKKTKFLDLKGFLIMQ
jgi:hypothetical protein